MKYDALDDAQLIARVVGRDPDALDALYRRYGRLVYGIALRIVHDAATAEEVTFDIFAAVWRKGQSYRPRRGKVSTWLAQMARNRAIDRVRRQAVRPEGHAVYLEEMLVEPAAEANPERQTHLSLQRQAVLDAIAQLRLEEQEVLFLALFGGLTHREIAAHLELPLGTVKGRIRSGMQRLRHDLGA